MAAPAVLVDNYQRARPNTKEYSPLLSSSVEYDVEIRPVLRGLTVLAPGTVKLQTLGGGMWSHTFEGINPTDDSAPAHITFPYTIHMQIRQIIGDGSGSVSTDSSGTTLSLDDELTPLK